MYIKNNKSTQREPCGTPAEIMTKTNIDHLKQPSVEEIL